MVKGKYLFVYSFYVYLDKRCKGGSNEPDYYEEVRQYVSDYEFYPNDSDVVQAIHDVLSEKKEYTDKYTDKELGDIAYEQTDEYYEKLYDELEKYFEEKAKEDAHEKLEYQEPDYDWEEDWWNN